MSDNNCRLKTIVTNNIKYYREQNNLSREELSVRLGKTKKFIENLEQEKYKKEPTLVLVENISIILNVPIVKFFTERESDWRNLVAFFIAIKNKDRWKIL